MTLGLPTIDYVVIGAYMVMMLVIGAYFTRLMKGGKDFFIGGNLIPWWVAGLSMYMSLFSAWTFTGAASFIYNTSWFGILYLASWPLTLFIGFQLAAKKWRRARITTPVEYLTTRFNRSTHIFFTFVLVITSLYWPGHHLASLAKITAPTLFPNSMAAIDMMIVAIGLIILVYTYSGGYWAVAVTDVVQFLILFAVLIILLPVIFLSGDFHSFGDFVRQTPPLKFTHLVRGNTLYDIWYLLAIPFVFVFSYTTGGNAQRYFSVKDDRAAKKVGWLAFGLMLLGPILFGLPPLIGKVLWPDISMLDYFAGITKADENIFIAVVMRYMPAGMVGIFLAAMMAASMSAMDSAWNTLSSIISIDIYKTLFKPKASEKEVLLVGRLTVLFLSLATIGLALAIIHSPYGVFTVTNIVFGLIGAPVAVPLLMGILVKNISRWSAISSILVGIITASVTKFALNYPLGKQYIATTIVTLLFIFISNPMGRIYLKSKKEALFANSFIGLILGVYFMTFNENSNLSWSQMGNAFQNGVLGFFGSSFFWLLTSVAGYIVLGKYFSRLYAEDVLAPKPEVDEFFERLKTPVDAKKEVLKDGIKEVNVFPLVGTISIIIAAVSMLLLISPSSRSNHWVNIAFSSTLFLTGIAMIATKYFHKTVGEN